jgi:hypothetical protein
MKENVVMENGNPGVVIAYSNRFTSLWVYAGPFSKATTTVRGDWIVDGGVI